MDQVKLAVVQLNTKVNEIQSNLLRANELIRECAKQGADIVCLPEAFATTINFPKIKEQAELVPGGSICNELCCWAKEYHVFITAGIIEKDEEQYYSTSVLIDHEGNIIGKYRRKSVYLLEQPFISKGTQVAIFDTKIGKIGLINGNDINFPDITWSMFKEQVEIIICTAQIPLAYRELTHIMAQARAIENCCYFVLASSCGKNTIARLEFMGGSMVARSCVGLEPLGFNYISQNNILASCEDEEAVIYVELDMKKLRREKEENPHYQALFGNDEWD